MKRSRQVIGILGGMGPEATLCLYYHLLRLNKGQKEQDHAHVIIDSNPSIPDRTCWLLEKKGEDPFPYLLDSGRRLQAAGADIIGIPCNTAHFFWEKLQEQLKVEIVNMVFLAEKEGKRTQKSTAKPVLLLATEGTYQAQLYESSFFCIPEQKVKKELMEVIYDVKSGEPLAPLQERVMKIIDRYRKDAGGVLLGCTELSLLYKPPYGRSPLWSEAGRVIDPLYLLAQELLRS